MVRGSAAEAALHQVRSLGVTLNSDYFGTGYPSLCYLQRSPIGTKAADGCAPISALSRSQ